MKILHKKLIGWYTKNKRPLPWRQTSNPYKIWVSEIILQQTQIKTGIKYYEHFIKTFPNVKTLANCSELDILKVWQGLGYYSRALNMLHSAKKIMLNYEGVFPSKYNDLIQLKGIGDYTAAAISSICEDEKQAVVDGNVYRFLSRLYNIKTPINKASGQKLYKNIANKLMPNNNTGTYNQAIMEFGSIHCTKNNPKCQSCIFKKQCVSLKLDTIKLRPVKIKNIKKKTRYLNYLFLTQKNHFLVKQRGDNDIWKKLYELPLIESKKLLKKEQLIANRYFKLLKKFKIKNPSLVNHKLSHQNLKILFWEIQSDNINNLGLKKISIQDLEKYPFPTPLKNYIDKALRNI